MFGFKCLRRGEGMQDACLLPLEDSTTVPVTAKEVKTDETEKKECTHSNEEIRITTQNSAMTMDSLESETFLSCCHRPGVVAETTPYSSIFSSLGDQRTTSDTLNIASAGIDSVPQICPVVLVGAVQTRIEVFDLLWEKEEEEEEDSDKGNDILQDEVEHCSPQGTNRRKQEGESSKESGATQTGKLKVPQRTGRMTCTGLRSRGHALDFGSEVLCIGAMQHQCLVLCTREMEIFVVRYQANLPVPPSLVPSSFSNKNASDDAGVSPSRVSSSSGIPPGTTAQGHASSTVGKGTSHPYSNHAHVTDLAPPSPSSSVAAPPQNRWSLVDGLQKDESPRFASNQLHWCLLHRTKQLLPPITTHTYLHSSVDPNGMRAHHFQGVENGRIPLLHPYQHGSTSHSVGGAEAGVGGRQCVCCYPLPKPLMVSEPDGRAVHAVLFPGRCHTISFYNNNSNRHHPVSPPISPPRGSGTPRKKPSSAGSTPSTTTSTTTNHNGNVLGSNTPSTMASMMSGGAGGRSRGYPGGRDPAVTASGEGELWEDRRRRERDRTEEVLNDTHNRQKWFWRVDAQESTSAEGGGNWKGGTNCLWRCPPASSTTVPSWSSVPSGPSGSSNTNSPAGVGNHNNNSGSGGSGGGPSSSSSSMVHLPPPPHLNVSLGPAAMTTTTTTRTTTTTTRANGTTSTSTSTSTNTHTPATTAMNQHHHNHSMLMHSAGGVAGAAVSGGAAAASGGAGSTGPAVERPEETASRYWCDGLPYDLTRGGTVDSVENEDIHSYYLHQWKHLLAARGRLSTSSAALQLRGERREGLQQRRHRRRRRRRRRQQQRHRGFAKDVAGSERVGGGGGGGGAPLLVRGISSNRSPRTVHEFNRRGRRAVGVASGGRGRTPHAELQMGSSSISMPSVGSGARDSRSASLLSCEGSSRRSPRSASSFASSSGAATPRNVRRMASSSFPPSSVSSRSSSSSSSLFSSFSAGSMESDEVQCMQTLQQQLDEELVQRWKDGELLDVPDQFLVTLVGMNALEFAKKSLHNRIEAYQQSKVEERALLLQRANAAPPPVLLEVLELQRNQLQQPPSIGCHPPYTLAHAHSSPQAPPPPSMTSTVTMNNNSHNNNHTSSSANNTIVTGSNAGVAHYGNSIVNSSNVANHNGNNSNGSKSAALGMHPRSIVSPPPVQVNITSSFFRGTRRRVTELDSTAISAPYPLLALTLPTELVPVVHYLASLEEEKKSMTRGVAEWSMGTPKTPIRDSSWTAPRQGVADGANGEEIIRENVDEIIEGFQYQLVTFGHYTLTIPPRKLCEVYYRVKTAPGEARDGDEEETEATYDEEREVHEVSCSDAVDAFVPVAAVFYVPPHAPRSTMFPPVRRSGISTPELRSPESGGGVSSSATATGFTATGASILPRHSYSAFQRHRSSNHPHHQQAPTSAPDSTLPTRDSTGAAELIGSDPAPWVAEVSLWVLLRNGRVALVRNPFQWDWRRLHTPAASLSRPVSPTTLAWSSPETTTTTTTTTTIKETWGTKRDMGSLGGWRVTSAALQLPMRFFPERLIALDDLQPVPPAPLGHSGETPAAERTPNPVPFPAVASTPPCFSAFRTSVTHGHAMLLDGVGEGYIVDLAKGRVVCSTVPGVHYRPSAKRTEKRQKERHDNSGGVTANNKEGTAAGELSPASVTTHRQSKVDTQREAARGATGALMHVSKAVGGRVWASFAKGTLQLLAPSIVGLDRHTIFLFPASLPPPKATRARRESMTAYAGQESNPHKPAEDEELERKREKRNVARAASHIRGVIPLFFTTYMDDEESDEEEEEEYEKQKVASTADRSQQQGGDGAGNVERHPAALPNSQRVSSRVRGRPRHCLFAAVTTTTSTTVFQVCDTLLERHEGCAETSTEEQAEEVVVVAPTPSTLPPMVAPTAYAAAGVGMPGSGWPGYNQASATGGSVTHSLVHGATPVVPPTLPNGPSGMGGEPVTPLQSGSVTPVYYGHGTVSSSSASSSSSRAPRGYYMPLNHTMMPPPGATPLLPPSTASQVLPPAYYASNANFPASAQSMPQWQSYQPPTYQPQPYMGNPHWYGSQGVSPSPSGGTLPLQHMSSSYTNNHNPNHAGVTMLTSHPAGVGSGGGTAQFSGPNAYMYAPSISASPAQPLYLPHPSPAGMRHSTAQGPNLTQTITTTQTTTVTRTRTEVVRRRPMFSLTAMESGMRPSSASDNTEHADFCDRGLSGSHPYPACPFTTETVCFPYEKEERTLAMVAWATPCSSLSDSKGGVGKIAMAQCTPTQLLVSWTRSSTDSAVDASGEEQNISGCERGMVSVLLTDVLQHFGPSAEPLLFTGHDYHDKDGAVEEEETQAEEAMMVVLPFRSTSSSCKGKPQTPPEWPATEKATRRCRHDAKETETSVVCTLITYKSRHVSLVATIVRPVKSPQGSVRCLNARSRCVWDLPTRPPPSIGLFSPSNMKDYRENAHEENSKDKEEDVEEGEDINDDELVNTWEEVRCASLCVIPPVATASGEQLCVVVVRWGGAMDAYVLNPSSPTLSSSPPHSKEAESAVNHSPPPARLNTTTIHDEEEEEPRWKAVERYRLLPHASSTIFDASEESREEEEEEEGGGGGGASGSSHFSWPKRVVKIQQVSHPSSLSSSSPSLGVCREEEEDPPGSRAIPVLWWMVHHANLSVSWLSCLAHVHKATGKTVHVWRLSPATRPASNQAVLQAFPAITSGRRFLPLLSQEDTKREHIPPAAETDLPTTNATITTDDLAVSSDTGKEKAKKPLKSHKQGKGMVQEEKEEGLRSSGSRSRYVSRYARQGDAHKQSPALTTRSTPPGTGFHGVLALPEGAGGLQMFSLSSEASLRPTFGSPACECVVTVHCGTSANSVPRGSRWADDDDEDDDDEDDDMPWECVELLNLPCTRLRRRPCRCSKGEEEEEDGEVVASPHAGNNKSPARVPLNTNWEEEENVQWILCSRGHTLSIAAIPHALEHRLLHDTAAANADWETEKEEEEEGECEARVSGSATFQHRHRHRRRHPSSHRHRIASESRELTEKALLPPEACHTTVRCVRQVHLPSVIAAARREAQKQENVEQDQPMKNTISSFLSPSSMLSLPPQSILLCAEYLPRCRLLLAAFDRGSGGCRGASSGHGEGALLVTLDPNNGWRVCEAMELPMETVVKLMPVPRDRSVPETIPMEDPQWNGESELVIVGTAPLYPMSPLFGGDAITTGRPHVHLLRAHPLRVVHSVSGMPGTSGSSDTSANTNGGGGGSNSTAAGNINDGDPASAVGSPEYGVTDLDVGVWLCPSRAEGKTSWIGMEAVQRRDVDEETVGNSLHLVVVACGITLSVFRLLDGQLHLMATTQTTDLISSVAVSFPFVSVSVGDQHLLYELHTGEEEVEEGGAAVVVVTNSSGSEGKTPSHCGRLPTPPTPLRVYQLRLHRQSMVPMRHGSEIVSQTALLPAYPPLPRQELVVPTATAIATAPRSSPPTRAEVSSGPSGHPQSVPPATAVMPPGNRFSARFHRVAAVDAVGNLLVYRLNVPHVPRQRGAGANYASGTAGGGGPTTFGGNGHHQQHSNAPEVPISGVDGCLSMSVFTACRLPSEPVKVLALTAMDEAVSGEEWRRGSGPVSRVGETLSTSTMVFGRYVPSHACAGDDDLDRWWWSPVERRVAKSLRWCEREVVLPNTALTGAEVPRTGRRRKMKRGGTSIRHPLRSNEDGDTWRTEKERSMSPSPPRIRPFRQCLFIPCRDGSLYAGFPIPVALAPLLTRVEAVVAQRHTMDVVLEEDNRNYATPQSRTIAHTKFPASPYVSVLHPASPRPRLVTYLQPFAARSSLWQLYEGHPSHYRLIHKYGAVFLDVIDELFRLLHTTCLSPRHALAFSPHRAEEDYGSRSSTVVLPYDELAHEGANAGGTPTWRFFNKTVTEKEDWVRTAMNTLFHQTRQRTIRHRTITKTVVGHPATSITAAAVPSAAPASIGGRDGGSTGLEGGPPPTTPSATPVTRRTQEEGQHVREGDRHGSGRPLVRTRRRCNANTVPEWLYAATSLEERSTASALAYKSRALLEKLFVVLLEETLDELGLKDLQEAVNHM